MRTTRPARRRGTPARRSPPAPVAPGASVPRRSRRAAPSRAPVPQPAPSSGWRHWRTQSAAPAPPVRPRPAATPGNRAAIRKRPRPRAPAAASDSGMPIILSLVMPVKPLARSASKAREVRVAVLARSGSMATPGLICANVRMPARVGRELRRDASWRGRRCRSPCRFQCR